MAKKPRKHPPVIETTPGGKKDAGQTRGQLERDPKGRKGQYTGAGDSPLMKK